MVALKGMKKGRLLIIIGLVLVAIAAALYFGKSFFHPSLAALQISSTPETKVFLNNEEVGTTPYYSTDLKAGIYNLRLEPLDGQNPAAGWEQEIDLPANIMTSIDRRLATENNDASGRILSLEKTDEKNASSLHVIVDPEQATVFVNGESKGFTPYAENIPEDKYQLRIASSGYTEQSFEVKTVTGYRLNILVKLSKQSPDGTTEGTQSASETDENEGQESEETDDQPEVEEEPDDENNTAEKPYVKILETPTGWLRVRDEPSISGKELGTVKPGETYPYVDEDNGWYEIEYQEEESGWISGDYAELFE